METAPRKHISSWRNKNWNYRLEAKMNSAGCIVAPMSIIRYLSEKIQKRIEEEQKNIPRVKVIEPVFVIVIPFIKLLLSIASGINSQ